MFQPIGKVIEKRIGEYGFKNKILLVEISEILKIVLGKILDKNNSSRARVISFKKRVLSVKIPNQKICQRVFLEKKKVINLLNERVGENAIKKVVFQA